MKTEDVKNIAEVLRELGLSYEETIDAMKGVTNELRSAGRLWRKGDKSKLIMFGLALIAFPDPTISDVIGAILVSAGVIQSKMKRSTLHIEDVYNTFSKVIRELQTIKQGCFK